MHRLKLLIVVAFMLVFAAGWSLGTAMERAHYSSMSAPTTQPIHRQHPPQDGSWLKRELGLSADQDAKIREIWAPLASARGKYMDQWQQINRDRDDAVRNLLSADQKVAMDSIYSEAEAEQAALEGRRDKEYKDAVAKTNELLTPDQQKKYSNILAHQHGDHGRFPPRSMAPASGPGGPPPPHGNREPH
jgi:Spy/CpxP family protein refolding chaperone